MWTYPYMHDVDLDDYMMKVLPSSDEVAFNCYDDVWSVKACGLMICLLSMCRVYGDSHVHCTSRLRLRSWVWSYNDLCEVKWIGVQTNVTYCNFPKVLT